MNRSEALLKKADQNIDAAEMLLAQGYFEISATRSYYAMFYLAEALLFSKGLAFTSHSAVIAAFGKEFAKTKILDPQHHRNLINGFETRQLGDYSLEIVISQEKADELLAGAKAFCLAADDYFHNESD